jgi:hypothetical protein
MKDPIEESELALECGLVQLGPDMPFVNWFSLASIR